MKKKATKRAEIRTPRTGPVIVAPDPDKLSPGLAKLKQGELINALRRYQTLLNKALAEVSEAGAIKAILSARSACQEIQVIIARLIKLSRTTIDNRLPRKPKRKKPKHRPYTPSQGGSVWVVGQGQCRKPGSHRS